MTIWDFTHLGAKNFDEQLKKEKRPIWFLFDFSGDIIFPIRLGLHEKSDCT